MSKNKLNKLIPKKTVNVEGYPLVSSDSEGLTTWFNNNPNIAGMAIGAGLNGINGNRRVVLNPNLKDINARNSVYRNESYRHFFDENNTILPEITNILKEAYIGTPYEGLDRRIQETEAARYLSGDPSHHLNEAQKAQLNKFRFTYPGGTLPEVIITGNKHKFGGNLFLDGGSMNYKYRGTIFDDDLKNQGITHIAELPEVTVKGRDYTKNKLNKLIPKKKYNLLELEIGKPFSSVNGLTVNVTLPNIDVIGVNRKPEEGIKAFIKNAFERTYGDTYHNAKEEYGKGYAGVYDNTIRVGYNNGIAPLRDRLQQYGAIKGKDGVYRFKNPNYKEGSDKELQQVKSDLGFGDNTDYEFLKWCAENANTLNRALGKPTTGDAWTRHGLYGDSIILQAPIKKSDYHGIAKSIRYLSDLGKYIDENIENHNLKTGDIVDIRHGGSSFDDTAWKKGDSDRANTHTGTILKTGSNKTLTFVVHSTGNGLRVEPIGDFLGSGIFKKNYITGIRRPGTKKHPYKYQNGGKNVDSAKYFTLTLTEPNGKSEYQEHIDFGYTPEEAISYARETERRFADAPNSGYIAGELPEVTVTPGYGNATTLLHLLQMIPSKEHRKKFAVSNRAGIISDNEYIDRMYKLWKDSKKPDWKTKKSFFYRPYYNVLTNTITAPAKHYLAELSHAYQFRHLFPDLDFNYLGLFGDIKIGGKSGYDRVNNPEYQAHSIIAPVLSNYVQGEINYKDIDPAIKKRLYKAKQKTKYLNGGYIITPSGRKMPFIDKRNKSSIIDGGELPEVTVTGYAPLRLTTYYPIVSKLYPFTGHSRLDIPIDTESWEKYLGTDESGDDSSPYIIINKKPKAKDYNLITNNCADAVLKYLNKAFGTNEKPHFFTTPGDVRDYALKHLNGKLIKNKNGSDTVLIPRNAKTASKISTAAVNLYDGDYEGTVFWNYQ